VTDREHAVGGGAGKKIPGEFVSADGGWSATHFRSVSRRTDGGDSGSLAPSLRNGSRSRRSVLGENRSGHATLLHGCGSDCAVCSCFVGTSDSGGRVRRSSYRIWNSNREELRWLRTGRLGMTPARRIQ